MYYGEMKKAHQKEVNDFKGLYFAFSDDQLNEILKKNKIEIKDLAPIGVGTLVLKSRHKAFNKMIEKNEDELKNAMNGDVFALSAFKYEIANHEGEISDALDALNLEYIDLIPERKELFNRALNSIEIW